MSSALNRSLSTAPAPTPPYTSLPPASVGGLGGASVVSGLLGARQLVREGAVISSPLQIFVRAKKKINDIYQEVQDYVGEARQFMEATAAHSPALVTAEDLQGTQSNCNKVHGIKEVLARDHMKVVFFGRTSNGKSTVINAMLGDKILPSGFGHTTNCFLQVEGVEGGEPYLMTEGSSERQSVKGISQLAHALCNNRLGDSTLVHIHWPKTRCPLLRDDVVLVDSPGIDVTECLDEWIDRHCLDADVFVLVANAESTLMKTEKNFFHKVAQKLSSPNIFILQNRWDTAASETDYVNEVRKQHSERTTAFLVDELKVVTASQASERIFFVSAKEVLQQRLTEAKGGAASGFPEGFTSRYFEFEQFERKFEECISKSAVITKFDQHTRQGKSVVSKVGRDVGAVMERAGEARAERVRGREELWSRLNHTEQQLHELTDRMKQKIGGLVDQVEQRVSSALNEEIRRLSVLVDDYPESFHPDPLVLGVYKRGLHAHVEAALGCNLRARLSSALALNIESVQNEMTCSMQALLGGERGALAASVVPRREPFEVLYRLNCDNLCADFQEDIEFKFSLGLVSLVHRLMGRAANSILNTRHKDTVPRSVPLTPLTPSNEGVGGVRGLSQDDWSILSRVALGGVGSQGTMGLALALGLMFKTVGWRVLAVTGGVYAGLYLYERLTWTTKAKERTFKRQYVDHATKKLRLIVDLTSHNCSHQVQQELSSTFARLCRLVDESTSEMQRDVRCLEREANQLEETVMEARKLKNKASYLCGELDTFTQTYLITED